MGVDLPPLSEMVDGKPIEMLGTPKADIPLRGESQSQGLKSCRIIMGNQQGSSLNGEPSTTNCSLKRDEAVGIPRG